MFLTKIEWIFLYVKQKDEIVEKLKKKETQSSPKGFVSQNDNYKNKIKIYYVHIYLMSKTKYINNTNCQLLFSCKSLKINVVARLWGSK